uniref:Uncharacterized protein n=1 Tax=Cucumis sativus TaxID=3659 RepID=A0A0A0KH07_CUCSA
MNGKAINHSRPNIHIFLVTLQFPKHTQGFFHIPTFYVHIDKSTANYSINVDSIVEHIEMEPSSLIQRSKIRTSSEQTRNSNTIKFKSCILHLITKTQSFYALSCLNKPRNQRRPRNHILQWHVQENPISRFYIPRFDIPINHYVPRNSISFRNVVKQLACTMNLTTQGINMKQSIQCKNIRPKSQFDNQSMNLKCLTHGQQITTSSKQEREGVGIMRYRRRKHLLIREKC